MPAFPLAGLLQGSVQALAGGTLPAVLRVAAIAASQQRQRRVELVAKLHDIGLGQIDTRG